MRGISLYRNILCMTAVVMALFMGTALAAPRAMTVDDVVIAGIAPGSALSYVRSIYGEPDGEKTIRIGNYNHPAYLVDYYGQGFVITYNIMEDGAWNPLVQKIESTNAALMMPSGLHVGMKIADVQQIFSNLQERPSVDKNAAKDYVTPIGDFGVTLSNGKEGIRFAVFTVDKKGIVQKILLTDKYADI